jgi:hypothetical protein
MKNRDKIYLKITKKSVGALIIMKESLATVKKSKKRRDH